MQTNLIAPSELKPLNVVSYFEYGDDYNDFFQTPFSDGDQDIVIKYCKSLEEAQELYNKLKETLTGNIINVEQRVTIVCSKRTNDWAVGLVEEDQFSIWFNDMNIGIEWDVEECHSYINEWIKLF